MALGIAVKWPMIETFLNTVYFLHDRKAGLSHVMLYKPFPNVINSGLIRVQHVFGIEAIVTQFIHHNFITRKIVHCCRRIAGGMHQLMNRCNQMRFASLIFNKTVFEMTHR